MTQTTNIAHSNAEEFNQGIANEDTVSVVA